MPDWERFDLHPWDCTRRFKYGRVKRFRDGWVVIGPNPYSAKSGPLRAIWHMIAGNPICWVVATGKSISEVERLADEWTANRVAARSVLEGEDHD